jgi:hypothetical protein
LRLWLYPVCPSNPQPPTCGGGDLDAHALVLGELRAERASLREQLGRVRARELELDETRLVELVKESLADLRDAFVGAPEQARATFRALLGDRRIPRARLRRRGAL